MTRHLKVLLIGGRSHVGKSTVAGQLAEAPGWRRLSTDQLARHPGDPWRTDGPRLPGDVVRYYSTASVNEMLDPLLRHDRDEIWPIAGAIGAPI